MRSLRLGSATVLALLALPACDRAVDWTPSAPPERLLEAGDVTVAADLESAGVLVASQRPRLRTVAKGPQQRRAVVLPLGAALRWRVAVPDKARLVLGATIEGPATSGGTMEVAVVADDRRDVLLTRELGELAPGWTDLDAALGRYAGREVVLEMRSTTAGDLKGRIAWSPIRLVTRLAGRPSAPPNVLLVVVDTLRADHLSAYGYERRTSPEIDARLAAQGVLLEHAGAPAPWTLPSMASLMTGELPGRVLGHEAGSYQIPESLPLLAERLRTAGYATAAYVANPTLHAGNGFGRGVDDLYVAAAESAFTRLHAEDLTRRAERFVDAHRHQPFFLWVHYLAPHDPYANTDQFLGRSWAAPTYTGRLRGHHIHELFLDQIQLDDREKDLRHLVGLYDSEIRYVDRFIGRLLDSLPPAARADTLVVLTSDHGEELLDHGSWKHGRTLYEEQLHVPLILRWPGKLPAGRRVETPVRLSDLAATLLELVGLEPLGGGSGFASLLLGGEAPAGSAAFAERLNFGRKQASVSRDGKKLILYDRHGAVPDDQPEVQVAIEARELARLRRIEAYDLVTDPHEERNLAATAPNLVRRLEPALHRELAGTLPGLRLLVGDLPPGAVMRVDVELAPAPRADRGGEPPKAPDPEPRPVAWQSYFLGPQDRATIDGTMLHLELHADPLLKGVVVTGVGELGGLRAAVEGAAAASPRIFIGNDAEIAADPSAGKRMRREDWLGIPAFEARGGAESAPLLYVFEPRGSAPARHSQEDPETVRRLRAMGYLNR